MHSHTNGAACTALWLDSCNHVCRPVDCCDTDSAWSGLRTLQRHQEHHTHLSEAIERLLNDVLAGIVQRAGGLHGPEIV